MYGPIPQHQPDVAVSRLPGVINTKGAAAEPISAKDVLAQIKGWTIEAVELSLRVAETYGDVREVQGRWEQG